MTRQEAAKLVAVMVAAYPSQSVKIDGDRIATMVDAFAELLEDLTYEQANAALRVIVQTRTWMPSVAEIRATVLELQHGRKRKGGEAWGTVLQAISCEGAYCTPGQDFYFKDPVTAKCVSALSWKELCLSENQVADRARFIELYDQLASDAYRAEQSPMLAAAHQRTGTVVSLAEMLPKLLEQPNRDDTLPLFTHSTTHTN